MSDEGKRVLRSKKRKILSDELLRQTSGVALNELQGENHAGPGYYFEVKRLIKYKA